MPINTDVLKVKNPEQATEFLNAVKDNINSLENRQNTIWKEVNNIWDLWKGSAAFNSPNAGIDDAKLGGLVKALSAKQYSRAIELGAAPQAPDWVEKADLGTPIFSDAVTGSYLVPTELATQVMRVAGEKSVFYPYVTKMPMKSRQKNIPVESTAATLTWATSQATALTETNPTFSQKTLTAYTLAGWIGLTESLLEDDVTAVGMLFREQLTDDLADELDNQILNGTGTPWTGILQDSSINTYTMTGKNSFNSIEWTDIINCISELTATKYRRDAHFFANPTCVDSLRKILDANGRPILMEASASYPKMLAGYPLHESDNMPESAASTIALLFGNPKNFVLGERIGLSIELFDKTAYAVEYEEIFFRARARFGGVVAIPAAFAVLKTSA